MINDTHRVQTATSELISDFDYELPEELIAQHPLDNRDAARMLVLDRAKRRWCDTRFLELASYLTPGDLVVVNNTRVFPARLVGRREPSGGRVEVFLLREHGPRVWETLARPARRLQQNSRLFFGDGRLSAEVLELLPGGRRMVRFECEGPFEEALDVLGQTPLPPYIKRNNESSEDRQIYQTVYASARGAIAAPTAGLHFTRQAMDKLEASGIGIAELTLHVGYGTFEPVRVRNVIDHRVAPERYEMGESSAKAINETHARGNRIVAIGTTTTRALESATDENGRVVAGAGEARLTITPGYKFRVVDSLLTNFHLPRSSLLILIAAFAGRDLVLEAYEHAVAEHYRFYSYGDCMLII